MIQLKSVNKHYWVSEKKHQVIDNINLLVNKGDFLGIVGPSGSGKSSLLNIIGILDTDFEGEYLFNNQSVQLLKDDELSKLRNKSVGFIFQNFQLLPSMTISENIALPLLYQGFSLKKQREKIAKVLTLVGLEGIESKYPNQLSGGQKQRVAIARAIIHNPKFLIADEPTGSLDSVTSLEIMDIFRKLNKQGTTIILVTHDHSLLKFCSKTLEVMDGKVIV